jgi:hypothetical protein
MTLDLPVIESLRTPIPPRFPFREEVATAGIVQDGAEIFAKRRTGGSNAREHENLW